MKRILAVLSVLLPHAAAALGPHELLVLVNTNSAASIRVALEFQRLRGIPDANVVYLDLTARKGVFPLDISPSRFESLIWSPAQDAMKSRGIRDHVLAWCYSVDFPVRVEGKAPLSLTGITFLKNTVPDSDAIKGGTYVSPIFAGPEGPGAKTFQAQSLDVSKTWLANDMPLPAMMLGVVAKFGNSEEAVIECLRSGAASDGTRPTGAVYFVTGEDIRCKARQWQFPAAAGELRKLGVACVVTNALPSGDRDILGILAGTATIEPGQIGTFAPGAFADHFTSFAGVFEHGSQTKLTAWIAAGAAASAGTVTEPYANPCKFPAARLFAHYASGCTMLESIYQSIRCPLQILPVGDPLAAPWAPKAEMTIELAPPSAGTRAVSVTVRVRCADNTTFTSLRVFLDGRPLDAAVERQGENTFRFTINRPGRLRAVAYSSGAVRRQSYAEREIQDLK